MTISDTTITCKFLRDRERESKQKQHRSEGTKSRTKIQKHFGSEFGEVCVGEKERDTIQHREK